ncbi:hypothetical protein ACULNC_06365 [Shigella flexneri]
MTDLTAQEPAWQTRDHLDDPVIGELRNRFWPGCLYCSGDSHGVPVVWISVNNYWKLAISKETAETLRHAV